MTKLSEETIEMLRKYIVSEIIVTKITEEDIEEIFGILAANITELVEEIETKGNATEENYALLKELDDALDEINETENIDFEDLNERLKQ